MSTAALNAGSTLARVRTPEKNDCQRGEGSGLISRLKSAMRASIFLGVSQPSIKRASVKRQRSEPIGTAVGFADDCFGLVPEIKERQKRAKSSMESRP